MESSSIRKKRIGMDRTGMDCSRLEGRGLFLTPMAVDVR